MVNEIEYYGGGSIVVSDLTLMTVKGSNWMINGTGPAEKKSTETTPVRESTSGDEFEEWYADSGNTYPQQIVEKARKDPELPALIKKYTDMLYSGGMVYGKWVMDGDKRVFERIYDAEIENWLTDTNINLYLQEAYADAKWYSNAFAELTYDGRGKKNGQIVSISIQEAMFCRWSKQNDKGKKEKVYVSANWDVNNGSDKVGYEAIDPYFKPRNQIENLKGDVLYYPLIFPDVPGKVYYQQPSWHSLFDGKIFELYELQLLNELYYLKNGMNLRFHVEVDESYFERKYKDWKGKKTEEITAIFKAELEAFNKLFSGVDKSGKSMLTLKHFDQRTKAEYSEWTIHEIKPTQLQDTNIQAMNQKTLVKCRALGMDPTLIGPVGESRSSNSNGSGSNNRTSFHIHNIVNKPIHDQVASPFNSTIKYVNGWEQKHNGLFFMEDSIYMAMQSEITPENRI